MKKTLLLLSLLFSLTAASAQPILIETENFDNKGGWVVDQQFMDLMGSPYLMAHGLGKPVADASTTVEFSKSGEYSVYVRTYNWTAPWFEGEGPGRFAVTLDGRTIGEAGDQGSQWEWQKIGSLDITAGKKNLKLRDLTGFNGRCDAILFSPKSNITLPESAKERQKLYPEKTEKSVKEYDFVVVGGGVAGMCAAMAAAREGLDVALINDRPVLGGNNSSEIRVHLGGYVNVGPYKNLGNMLREFGPSKVGNAQPAANYEDQKKQEWLDAEDDIELYAPYRALGVKMAGDKIVSVSAVHIETGEEVTFKAPIFSDCTGDGTIAYLAGAEYMMGREARSEFGEPTAPEVADKMTMGSSVQWYADKRESKSDFPVFKYGMDFNEKNSEKVTMGEWTWETGMNLDQIKDFERVRDYGMLVIFSNWSFLKNEYSAADKYANHSLGWVAYVAGKRESRRIIGDVILTENDITSGKKFEDGTAATSWTIDLHYPDPHNTKNFPEKEFKSIAKHIPIHYYPVPYRTLYARDVENLFLAGRNISVTHVALGTIRVMRTTAMLGEVVGMAAALCDEHNTTPRGVYTNYLSELKEMMAQGAGDTNAPDNQHYNEGSTLGDPKN